MPLDLSRLDLLTAPMPPPPLIPLILAQTPPIWHVVVVMTLGMVIGLPFMLRKLWPGMKPKTVWILTICLSLVFLFVMAPAMVALSSNLRR